MATLAKTFNFPDATGTSEGGTWTATAGANTAGSIVSGDDQAGLGGDCLQLSMTGKNHSSTSYWQWAGLWTDLDATLSGATITAVQVDYYWRCSTYTTGAASTVGGTSDGLYDSGGTLQAANTIAASSYSATTLWTGGTAHKTDSALTVPSGLQAASSSIQLRLYAALATGSSTSAVNTLHQDTVTVTITYTAAAPAALPELVMAPMTGA